MSKITAQNKKRTLLDDFQEIEELNQKGHLDILDSESETNTFNNDTEQASRANLQNMSREFGEESVISNPFKKAQKPQGGINGRSHAPQVIDEDTEHFKVKIEHLLNVFKADSISEFMGMKRSMLEDQRCQVKSQTERYLQMYEDKHKEEAETRNKYESEKSQNAILRERLDKMSSITQKSKSRFHTLKALQFFFAAMKNHRNNQLQKKKHKKMAQAHAEKNIKLRVFGSFAKICRESKREQVLADVEKKHEDEIEEITHRYNKEMQQLKEQLKETQFTLQQVNVTKESMQENLKKAFMRGVCALNFEAMNAIQGAPTAAMLDSFEQGYPVKNISQTPSTFSSQFPTSQTQQFATDTQMMQAIVQKNPQQFNSLLLNPNENNNNISGNSNINLYNNKPFNGSGNNHLNFNNNTTADVSDSAIASATFSQMKGASFNGSNGSQEMETLNTDKLGQIEFLKRELESIQKMVGGKEKMKFQEQEYGQQQQQQSDEDFEYAQKKIILFSEPKAESKDHKWKNAPVVGLPPTKQATISYQSEKENVQQQEQSLPQYNFNLPTFSDNFGLQQDDEIKVIRVAPQKQDSFSSIPKQSSKQNDIKPSPKEPSSTKNGDKKIGNGPSSTTSIKSSANSQKNGSAGTPLKNQKQVPIKKQ